MPNTIMNPQQAALDRRRAMALALQAQGMAPLQSPPVRGARISPWEGVSKIASSLMGAYQNNQLDQQQAALSGQENADRISQALALSDQVMPPTPGNVTLPPTQGLPLPQLNAPPPPTVEEPQMVRDTRAASVKAVAKALASPDPVLQDMGKTIAQSLLTGSREEKAQASRMAERLAAQDFDQQQAAQQQAFQGGNTAYIQANENARNQADIVSREKIASMKPEPQPKNPVSATIIKVGGDGKPHIFRQDATTGAFSIDEGLQYEKPTSSNATESADARSYTFHVKEIDARAKPIDEAANRYARLKDTIDQNTAQADALIAPELMTVMAGGLGSGLRINEAEINRVQGGRPKIAQVQAKIRSWLGTNQKEAINFGPDERKAINDLIALVGTKLEAKQEALTRASAIISGPDTTDQQRRTALAEMNRVLRAIDQGKPIEQAPAEGGGKIIRYDAKGNRIP